MADVLTKPQRETTADQAVAAIFEAIVAGTLEPGAPLRLQDIAGQLGMSMMPVREALRRLESLGLVEIEPYKGARLRPLSYDDMIDTYATRVNLESLAIRMAAERFGPEDAEKARQALGDQQRARARRDAIEARNAHERFHFTLYEAAGSPWLVRSILPAWRNSERYRMNVTRSEYHKQRAAEHRQILAALEAHDAEAAVERLVAHLRVSVELAVASIPDAPEDGALALPSVDDLLPRSHGG